MKLGKLLLFFLTFALALPAAPQNVPQNAASSLAASAPTAVPPLIPYSGVVNTLVGQAASANTSVTFLIYSEEQGGEPLYSETQSVAIDSTGHFKAQIGATLTNGIPIDLFASGEARWLAVQIAGEAPQPRVLLLSVPYALKAADASTLGGLPASAFALAGAKSPANAAVVPAITPDTATDVTTTGGTAGYLAEFSGASSIVDSPVFVNGANVGIGKTTPATTLDVNGTVTATGLTVNGGNTSFYGPFLLQPQGTATASAAYYSQNFKFTTSVYNSSTQAAVTPRFQLQAVPLGNNTAAPSAMLALYSSTTSASPSRTGFSFNIDGTINFAPGQTFPGGTGTGTITGVTAGTALTGGGTSGNVTLNLDTTKVPLLTASNSFTGNQTIAGNLSASGTASAGTVNAATFFDIGGLAFVYGSYASGNVYLGFAGDASTTSGVDNTASGYQALYANTTGNENTANGFGALLFNTSGSYNTASGVSALLFNTTGSDNTASGTQALFDNTTGGYNTASGYNSLSLNTTGGYNVGIGFFAGETAEGASNLTGSFNTAVGTDAAFGTGSLTNATAIGAFSEVDQSNTLVLGCISHLNSCPGTVSVGIGTTTPDSLLTVNGSADKPGGGSWGTYSDGRLKTVNGSFGGGLNQVMQLRPIRYRYKADNGMGIRDMAEHIGVVAQEVQRVIPEAVTENGKGYMIVNNDPIIWSMVNAIKEQQREIEQRRTENQEQKNLLRVQSAAIEEQRKMLRAQSAAMQSLAAEVRETRKTLHQVKAQAATGQTVMMASK